MAAAFSFSAAAFSSLTPPRSTASSVSTLIARAPKIPPSSFRSVPFSSVRRRRPPPLSAMVDDTPSPSFSGARSRSASSSSAAATASSPTPLDPPPLADRIHVSPFLSGIAVVGSGAVRGVPLGDATAADAPADAPDPNAAPNAALVVLNTPMRRPPSDIFRALWDASSLRVCADGGANRLYDATVGADDVDGGEGGGSGGGGGGGADEDDDDRGGGDRRNLTLLRRYVPDLIRGDLDSLRSDVRDHYEAMGCIVERDPDQDTNDLDKAMAAVAGRRMDDGGGDGSQEEAAVYVYGAFGGRFDQEMANVKALYRWSVPFGHRTVLYGDEACAFLLPPGVRNVLRLLPTSAPTPTPTRPTGEGKDEDDEPEGGGGKSGETETKTGVGEGPTCGLLPVGGRCDSVVTTGLEWDLDGTIPLDFFGLVSTSNRIVGEEVTVVTSHPIVFTAEMMC